MLALSAFALPGLLLRIVFLAGVTSLPLLAQGQTASPGGSVWPDVPRDHPVKVVYPVVMPPYTFEDIKGEAQGLAIDLLRLWSEKTGIPIQFKSAAWGDGLQMMLEKKADIHASLYLSEEREQYLTYAAIVAASQGTVFYHKSIVTINEPGDLRAFRVGVVKDSYHEQYIRQHVPEAPLVSYPDFPEMLLAAQQGDIRVFVEDAGTTLYRLKERGLLDDFRYKADQALYRNNFWIAVHRGNAGLAKALQEGIGSITAEERATLERKWLPGTLIRTPDTLFVAMSTDNAPYSFVNAEGNPAGFFVDIWKLWAQKTGKKVEFLPSDWDAALNNVRHGNADLHSGMFRSETGAQWFDYSDPFYESGSSLFHLRRTDEKKSGSDRNLTGKKIGVVQGTYHEQYLRREHPDVHVILFSTREKMLRAVINGDTEACLAEDASTGNLISQLGLSGLFEAEPLMPFAQPICAGVPKGNAQLLSLVNDGLRAITKSEMEDIQQRWAMGSEEAHYENLLKWFLIVVGTALTVIFVFVLWNRSLSRRVKLRTAILAESEERFRATFEQAAVGIAHVSPEGRFLRVNKKFCDLLGYSREEMLQRTFQEITHPDDLDPDLESVSRALSGEIDTYFMEKRYIRKDGSTLWLNLTVALVRNESGQPRWFVSVVQDISDSRRDREALQQREFQLASAIDVAGLGFYEATHGGLQVSFADSRALELVGSPAGQEIDESIHWSWLEHIHPEDSARIIDLSRRLNEGPLDRIAVEYRYQHPVRGPIWLHHLARVIERDTSGRSIHVIGVLRDITNRKQAEEALVKSQRLLAEMERVGKVGGWEIDLNTMKLRWTAEVYGIHEVDPSFELTMERAIQFYSPASRPVIERLVRRAIEHGESYDTELEIITAKGNQRSIHTIGMADLENRRVYGFIQDITASKENEREVSNLRLELTHLTRVLTMNEISGSLAHEINQPLAAILNNATAARNVMLRTPDRPEEISEIIEDIIQDADRAAAIIRKLRNLVKKGNEELDLLPINSLIEDVLELLHNTIVANKITLKLNLAPDLASIRGDRVRLQQVILNLLINAVDAMKETPSKILAICSRMDAPEIVTVSITDSGPGIDEAGRALLFQPFFTTKSDGLGLGLSICRSIIQGHGGRIWEENNPGGGAKFSFSLKTWEQESA